MRDHFVMMAGYNAWANAQLYAAAAGVSEEEYRADRGAFFGSLHRTLNHLVLTDGMWRTRLGGGGALPPRLDLELHQELETLRTARVDLDGWLSAYVGALDDGAIARPFRWTRVADGAEVVQPMWALLAHVFNHQAHHRGQAHAILTSLRGPDFAPSLDLPLYQRESGLGWSP